MTPRLSYGIGFVGTVYTDMRNTEPYPVFAERVVWSGRNNFSFILFFIFFSASGEEFSR